MLTLEEAIKPILEEEAVDGYGPVCAYEGKYHWFVGFGFDGKMARATLHMPLTRKRGGLTSSRFHFSSEVRVHLLSSLKCGRLKRFPSPRQQQAPPRRGLFMPITITFISLKKAGRCVQCQECHAPKKDRGGAFNAKP